MATSLLLLSLLAVCHGLRDNFCHDLTDYGKLYFTKVKVNVCNVTLESKCEVKPVYECTQVPGVKCKAELYTKGKYFNSKL